jgi:hypothetical protein
MAEPALDRPGVVALVGERVAACVSEHVGMRLELKAGARGGTLDHPGKSGGRELGALVLFKFRLDQAQTRSIAVAN